MPPGLENEIDASLDRLEAVGDGPTGTSLPEGFASMSVEETAATRAQPNSRRPSKRPQDVAFNASTDETTESGQIIPHTLKEMRNPPKTELSAGATERPIRSTDPNIGIVGGGGGGGAEGGAPMTVPLGAPETIDGSALGTPQDLESGDLMDVEDPTGADMKVDLEATHAGREDEVVIADDLAEDDEEEHTDTGATVPPYRTNN
jgi:hypothetical protein